jgi:hypothetical protein
MKEHRTGFVPVCKRNVRVLSTGTNEEIKGEITNRRPERRQDQRMNDGPHVQRRRRRPIRPVGPRCARPEWVHARILRHGVSGEEGGRAQRPYEALRICAIGPHAQRRQCRQRVCLPTRAPTLRQSAFGRLRRGRPPQDRIGTMEPMPSRGMGGRDVEASYRKIRETTLRKKLRRPRERGPCRALWRRG